MAQLDANESKAARQREGETVRNNGSGVSVSPNLPTNKRTSAQWHGGRVSDP